MEYTPLYSESFEVASDDREVVSATTISGRAVVTKSQTVDAMNVVTASALSEGSFDPDSLQDPAEQSKIASTNSLSCISLEDECMTDVDQYSQTASSVQESPHKSNSHDGSKTTNAHLQADTQPPVSYQ